MFNSNIPIRLWILYAGILILTAFFCIIISYNIGLARAVISVNGDVYRPLEAEGLIINYIDKIEETETELTDLQTKYQGININYTALLEDFDWLNEKYETVDKEKESLAVELNKLTNEYAELNVVNENLRMYILELSNQLDDQKIQIEDLNAQVESLKSENTRQSTLVSDLRRRLEDIFNTAFGGWQ